MLATGIVGLWEDDTAVEKLGVVGKKRGDGLYVRTDDGGAALDRGSINCQQMRRSRAGGRVRAGERVAAEEIVSKGADVVAHLE